MMRKYLNIIAFTLALLVAVPSGAQQVTRSEQVPGLRPYKVDLPLMTSAEKDSVRMVADLWKRYVASFTDASISKEIRRSMWMDGTPDYLLEFDDGNLLYASFREDRILDIRKIGSGTYEIIAMTKSRLPGDEYADWVESVFRVCAMAVVKPAEGKLENPFRLCNWLDASIPTLARMSSGSIEYYCDKGCIPDKKVVQSVTLFMESFLDEYSINFSDPIRYVVAPDPDKCERLSGFLFNAYSNPLMATVNAKSTAPGFYGRTFGANTLLSNYFDDRHSIGLLLVRTGYPSALPMIHEGVAAYHGGYMTCSYKDVKASLQRFLKDNPGLDMADEDSFYDMVIPLLKDGKPNLAVAPLEGILGALLVEHALELEGPGMVRKLLECKNYPDLFAVFGIEARNINQYVRMLL